MRKTSKLICAIIGHDWEVVKRIPAPESLPNGVPVEQIKCKRCGEVALRISLTPGQAASVGSNTVIRYES